MRLFFKCRKILILPPRMTHNHLFAASPHHHVNPTALLYFFKYKLVQTVFSRHLVIFLWFTGFSEGDKVFCSIRNLLFKCFTLRKPPICSPLRCFNACVAACFDAHFNASSPAVIWSDWSKNVLSSLRNFDLKEAQSSTTNSHRSNWRSHCWKQAIKIKS